jgi:hypothetical protein
MYRVERSGPLSSQKSVQGDRETEDGIPAGRADRPWPVAWRRLVSAVLIFHLVAILAGALSAHPSSGLERSIADKFAAYFQLIDQGYAYRYYAPEPPPTPVATATVHYADGRPDRTIRLPRKETFPWLLRQRQLALANHLYSDFQAAKFEGGDASKSRWGRSYARHLAKTYPGSSEIELHAQLHLIPDVQRVREMLASPSSRGVDLDAEEFYTTPERIGAYPCDAF